MLFRFGFSSVHRRAGNRHRNNGEWALAAEAFRRHLDVRPDDAAIWVQLGHAEKEQSRFAEAESAYRQAAMVAPDDPDPVLHLAHLLKRGARSEEALVAFRRLGELDPSDETIEEIRILSLLRKCRKAVVARNGAVLFVLQDFFAAFSVHATSTGIQRVQAGVVRAAMADATLTAHFVVNDDESDDDVPRFLSIAPRALCEILDHIADDEVDVRTLRPMIEAARFEGIPIEPGPGSAIVLLGAFWGLGNGVERYIAAHAAGIRLVAFIYDVIPLTHPEYVEVNFSNAFWRALAELMRVVDLVLTISDHTRSELTRVLEARGGRLVPMATIPLAHSMRDRVTADPVWPAALAGLRRKPYVAYVSTVEGRKNHLYVVRAWQAMIERGVAVPDLLFVGRKGWLTEELDALLARTDSLGGRVHIVHGLSDGELQAVYARARFTVFTSVTEGWGLPVGESLSHGVPCVASRRASIPEVGGDLVDYVDIDDLEDGIRVFRRLIEDGGYLAARSSEIKRTFVGRTWDEVGSHFVSTLRVMLDGLSPVQAVDPVAVAEAVVFHPSEMLGVANPPDGYFARPLGLMLAESFYEADADGAWMRGEIGRLRFRIDAEPGEDFVVLLSLMAAPWAVGRRCSIEFTGDKVWRRRWMTLAPDGNYARIEGLAAVDRICALTIVYEGEARSVQGDPRRFAIGLRAIGHCRLDRSSLRQELRERLLFA